ncbi:MAG: asparagine synthetase B [Saprospiraceae bacterium]|nr:asparagine synthetase B [Saprospiraceae bacterium]
MASYIFIPMDDESQKNHLKAYGIAYKVLENGGEVYWLLNYKGGSFAFNLVPLLERECKIRDVSYSVITNGEFEKIRLEIDDPEINMDVMKLEKAPKVAVYTPEYDEKGEKIQPWDDAVTLALTYAEIPFDKIYDREVLEDKLVQYDWLHLHHEDFTGQYGKFYGSYRNARWYIDHQRSQEALAKSLGFSKVSKLKLAVVQKIKEFVGAGGFMFAMCSATDSYDIALAAQNTDICDVMFDGDPMEAAAQQKLDFSQTFAFQNFTLVTNPFEYEFSSIDFNSRNVRPEDDYFTLFDFSAKWDPVPTMLTQNHTRIIKGFMGQTTTFERKFLKSGVLVMGELKSIDETRYIHGDYGLGFWTFYGGHDPEDYRHYVGDPPTDLILHPNSPGYRLILNNILFPAARKKKHKT